MKNVHMCVRTYILTIPSPHLYTVWNISTRAHVCMCVYEQDAEASIRYLNGMTVDERIIRVDIDWGFKEGRQYGRGRSGGQVRLCEPCGTPHQ